MSKFSLNLTLTQPDGSAESKSYDGDDAAEATALLEAADKIHAISARCEATDANGQTRRFDREANATNADGEAAVAGAVSDAKAWIAEVTA